MMSRSPWKLPLLLPFLDRPCRVSFKNNVLLPENFTEYIYHVRNCK